MPKCCEACLSASALVYCRADAAFLCVGCDQKVHGANKLAKRHERVWVCAVCEVAPAVVTCKADAAELCADCDTDVHSANHLARRHERTPVIPFVEFPGPFVEVAHIDAPVVPQGFHQEGDEESVVDADEHSVGALVAWLFPNPNPSTMEQNLLGDYKGCLALENDDVEDVSMPPSSYLESSVGGSSQISPLQFKDDGMNFRHSKSSEAEANTGDWFPDLPPYPELDYATIFGSCSSMEADSSVPVHSIDHSALTSASSVSIGSESFGGDMFYKDGCSNESSLATASSSPRAGDPRAQSDISSLYDGIQSLVSFEFPLMVDIEAHAELPVAREARVMRYKEKKKNRKIEKSIRCASRKYTQRVGVASMAHSRRETSI